MPLGQIAALVIVICVCKYWPIHWLSCSQHLSQAVDFPVINTEANYSLIYNQYTWLWIYVKGHTFVNKHCRVVGLGQIVALMLFNKNIQFHEICFSTFKVIAKVQVCHNDKDDDENKDNNTRVMTIPRLFFFEKQPS